MLENKFRHKLSTQKIIIRQDEGSDETDISQVGQTFPLIRIGDTTFEKGQISSFTLNVGESLIPRITLTIDDADMNFRGFQLTDDFIRGDSLLTVLITIINDNNNESIKNDYKITNITGRSGSDTLTINAELYVPKMTSKRQWGFNGNSFDALKEIATFCELGFSTNITDAPTDDSLWLTNTNLENLIKDIEGRAFIDDDCLAVFIDAYANLTVLQLGKAIEDTTQYYFDTDINGNPIDQQKLLITDATDIEGEEAIPLSSWNSKSDLEKYLRNFTKGIYTDKTDEKVTDFDIEENEVKTSMADEATLTHDNGRFDRDNLHAQFGFSDVRNKQIRDALTQGTLIDFRIDRYTPYIFVGMNADFRMVYNIRTDTLRNQEDEISVSDALETFEPKKGEQTLPVSGKYHIQDLQYTYKRGAGDSVMFLKGTGLKQ